MKEIAFKSLLSHIFAGSLMAAFLVTAQAGAVTAVPFDRGVFLQKMNNGDGEVAVDMAVNNVVHADPTTMYMAAALAYKGKKLEDAAFLYYAAQMRAKFDMQRFHETGGDGIGSLYGALSRQVGEEVNLAIARDPQALVAVLNRLEAWSVQPAAPYDPGWAVQDRTRMSGNEEAILGKSIKDETLNRLRPMAELLSDPEYFSAFLIFQAFNFSPLKEQGSRQG